MIQGWETAVIVGILVATMVGVMQTNMWLNTINTNLVDAIRELQKRNEKP